MRPGALVVMLGLIASATAHARSASDSGKSPEDTASQDTADTATPDKTGTKGTNQTTATTGTATNTTFDTEPTTYPGATGYTAADIAGEPGGAPAMSLGCGGDGNGGGKAALWLGLPLVIGLRRR